MKRSYDSWRRRMIRFASGSVILLALWSSLAAAQSQPPQPELNDVHFHLTNYIQEGTDIHDFLKIMGTKVGRVALFGIPLQQEWSYQNSGDFAPTYYLQTDAPLYYYSFTDAYIAMAYRSLSRQERARFDPMITGFNPADMYAADHIRRVLQTFRECSRVSASSRFTRSLCRLKSQVKLPVCKTRHLIVFSTSPRLLDSSC